MTVRMLSSDYWTEYNQLLSEVQCEFGTRFAALASPTLSKQETVSSLYQSIAAGGRPSFPWRKMLEFLPRLLLALAALSYASLRCRVRKLPRDAVVFRTWLVPRCFADGTLSDDYFRGLPTDLAAYESVVVSYTPLNARHMRGFRNRRIGEANAILSYGLLSLSDVLKLLADYLMTALVQVKGTYRLDGRDVTPYVNASLLLDYLGLRSFEAYAEKYKCRKLADMGIKAFVYVFENQSWEKACCAELRKRGIRLIGYQSSGFSPVFLNFFPTMQDALHQPMPDVVLTVGDHFKRYLLEHGHYDVPVISFAALRFPYRHHDGRYVVQPANPRVVGRVLYAFSVHLDRYGQIIEDLIEVFDGTGIGVDLKLHPLYELDDVAEISRLPAEFRIVEAVDIGLLRETYDCILFDDNSFGIEALLHGVRSFQYDRNGPCADGDRFMYFDLWRTSCTREDMVRLRDEIRSGSLEKVFDVQAVSDYINKMYRPFTPDSLMLFRDLLAHHPQGS